MEVTYRTTAEDYVAFCQHALSDSRVFRRNYLAVWLAVPALLIVGGLAHYSYSRWDTTMTLVAVATPTCLLAYPPLHRLWVSSYLRRYTAQAGTRGVVGDILTTESLAVITETTRSEVHWRDVHRIDEEGDYTFIYVTPLGAAIVPRHGFPSESDYEAAISYARERFNHYHAHAEAGTASDHGG
jgi:hypothetical protein